MTASNSLYAEDVQLVRSAPGGLTYLFYTNGIEDPLPDDGYAGTPWFVCRITGRQYGSRVVSVYRAPADSAVAEIVPVVVLVRIGDWLYKAVRIDFTDPPDEGLTYEYVLVSRRPASVQ